METIIGPFISPYCTLAHYIVRQAGYVVVVVEGYQPHEGTKHGKLTDARKWMKDNGFILKSSLTKDTSIW